ncbi:hypothetical protein [Streptomyces montanisoli]|uniref:AraC-type arabinose-binding/dimerisation domain-containing protein n=1 Tax=Streptomyces montanisoli TaxID=2798581 RepID=A0A940M7Q2_9ACTN|nr:hypothetical protein [Streptomyces montanisoli]MBP0456319.1 hypothetical protein [Streptomyces montanisoli]
MPDQHHEPTGAPAPGFLCDVHALTAQPQAPAGALWKLAEPGRQLDANVIHLAENQHIETHAEPDLDVLLLVIAGHGTLHAPDGTVRLAAGALCWLPHGSSRSVTAGAEGLDYMTVHRRRPGMRIGRRQD